MVIQKAEIKKFRGFKEVSFELGTLLTVIAGQNGTQKTTILGMLTQPFTITDPSNPMKDERPLCGGSFKSGFSEKFKLSERFDEPKSHEWTLHFKGSEPFTIESIVRKKEKNAIRFWRKGNRSKGSGYIQLPAIFLSLKRLLPIGEDEKLEENTVLTLTEAEKQFFKEWHRKILLSFDEITGTSYLESPDKNTLGISTAIYDWKQNSSGQDNIGKILLAILSFKRLKEKYPTEYSGGILAIDELDATLYPASQLKLLEALRKFASNFSIQIIFTTHSLTILEDACNTAARNKDIALAVDQIKVIFLERRDNLIKPIQNVTYNFIKHRLNITINSIELKKIDAFTEDRECLQFAKVLLKSKASKINFVDCTLGASSLVDLGFRKIPSFSFPFSIVFLDGDVRGLSATLKKVNKLKNYVMLPGKHSPERLLAEFLYELTDDSDVWGNINSSFTKQYCFKDFALSDIQLDRVKAKSWYNSHLPLWGPNAVKVINPWITKNSVLANEFIEKFVETYNMFAKELSLVEL